MNRMFGVARRGRASVLAISIPARVYIMVIIFVLAMIILFLPMSYLSVQVSLATDAIHGVAPAWISLGVGIICLMPVVGVVSSETFKEKVQIGPLLFVAGIIGVGAVVADTGLGSFISELFLEASNLSPDDPLHGFFVLSGIAMLLGFFSTMPGVPAVLVPIASDLSVASGFELRTVLMTQVIGFSMVWLHYQVPPIIIGMQLAGVPMAVGFKVTALIGLISLVTLMPLLVVWWQFLGYLPDGALW
jgi:MFS family permease